MLLTLLLSQLALQPANPEGPIFTNPATLGSFAFTEVFPQNGRGTLGPCATSNPTGARGESLNVSLRGSTATCTKTVTGGDAATGISVGDVVSLANGVLRMEYNPLNGALGARLEDVGTNSALRSEELDNAAWTSTATVTANAAVPPNNTNQLSNAEQLSDVSGAALQGSCQTVSTTSPSQHTVFFYARAGTASKATVTMTGTGSSLGDCTASNSALNGTTWDIVGCTSPTAYAATLTAVTVCIAVGTVAADTGTIMAWGADYKGGIAYRSSYIPTLGVATTRGSEVVVPWIDLTATWGGATSACLAVSYTRLDAANTSMSGLRGFAALDDVVNTGSPTLAVIDNSGGPGTIKCFAGADAYLAVTGQPKSGRTICRKQSGTNGYTGITTPPGTLSFITPSVAAVPTPTKLLIGNWSHAGSVPINGIVSNVQLDQAWGRCQ